jgi:GNAT superfamily N-acetyltransferase
MLIKRLEKGDQAKAESIFRTAFGTQVRYEDPEKFAPGYSLLGRFVGEPEGAFGGYIDEQLVAVAFCSSFGSLGVFGPAAVKPDLWGGGIGQQLVQKAIEYFQTQGITKIGLTTFPESAKHVAMYHKLGFYPRNLIAMMVKQLDQDMESKNPPPFRKFSALPSKEMEEAFQSFTMITDTIYEGMHFCRQIGVVGGLRIGETLMIDDGTAVVGFALCHFGEGAETETGVCQVKQAAVLPGPKASYHFGALLEACMSYARERGAEKLLFGLNTGRRKAFDQALSLKCRIDSLGIAMHRPDVPFADGHDVYLIDDWR